MKICMLHNYTIWRGGAERLLFKVSHYLRKKGHDVDIYVLRDSPSNCFPELRKGLKVIPTSRFTRSKLFSAVPPLQALEMARNIRGSYDLLHAHNSPTHIAAMLAKQSPALRRTPVVWQCNEPHRLLHDTVERKFYRDNACNHSLLQCITELVGLKGIDISSRSLDKVAAKRAAAITTLSSYMADIVRRLYERDPIVVNPGIDTDQFRDLDSATVRSRYRLGNAPLVLTVSRLWPTKNLQAGLRAFSLVLHSVPRAYYMIVGDGPSRNNLQNLSKQLGIHEHCIFVSDSEVSNLCLFYAACDVFLFTSIGEPWGLVALEAMASGRPVVAPAQGGPMEFVEDGKSGILVNPLDIQGMASAVIRLLQNSSLAARISQRAAQRAADFSWEKMAREFELVYERVLRRQAA